MADIVIFLNQSVARQQSQDKNKKFKTKTKTWSSWPRLTIVVSLSISVISSDCAVSTLCVSESMQFLRKITPPQFSACGIQSVNCVDASGRVRNGRKSPIVSKMHWDLRCVWGTFWTGMVSAMRSVRWLVCAVDRYQFMARQQHAHKSYRVRLIWKWRRNQALDCAR